MEIYTSEEEQVDAVRRFFIENGKAMIVGVILGAGALAGWKYWQTYQKNTSLKQADEYQSITRALASKKTEKLAVAEQFVKNEKNIYATLTALQLAQHFVSIDNYEKAVEQLELAKTIAKDDNLQAIIVLRLARVQLQEKKFDEALQTLTAIKSHGWQAQSNDLRGDILLRKGDLNGAKEAYNKSVESGASQVLQSLIRMKLNNLAS